MLQKHIVIIVPGLGDQVKQLKIITAHFRNHGFTLIVHNIGWRNTNGDFAPKLQKLVKRIDDYNRGGAKVSLIGTSAGGSAVMNAFFERKKIVYRVVNVCGRLRTGAITGFRSFASKTKSSTSFAESVKLAEKRTGELTVSDRCRVLTVRPIFDEVVPSDTQILSGATNIRISTIGHVVSIALTLTVFSKQIFEFLK
jgi:hypothetical protein